MKKISLIVYDFDGTLVDTFADIAGLANATHGRLSIDAHVLYLNIWQLRFHLQILGQTRTGWNRTRIICAGGKNSTPGPPLGTSFDGKLLF